MTELKDAIVTLCNQSGLPLEAIMFVLKDTYRDAVDNLAIADARAKAEAAKEQAPADEIKVEKISTEESEIVEN